MRAEANGVRFGLSRLRSVLARVGPPPPDGALLLAVAVAVRGAVAASLARSSDAMTARANAYADHTERASVFPSQVHFARAHALQDEAASLAAMDVPSLIARVLAERGRQ